MRKTRHKKTPKSHSMVRTAHGGGFTAGKVYVLVKCQASGLYETVDDNGSRRVLTDTYGFSFVSARHAMWRSKYPVMLLLASFFMIGVFANTMNPAWLFASLALTTSGFLLHLRLDRNLF